MKERRTTHSPQVDPHWDHGPHCPTQLILSLPSGLVVGLTGSSNPAFLALFLPFAETVGATNVTPTRKVKTHIHTRLRRMFPIATASGHSSGGGKAEFEAPRHNHTTRTQARWGQICLTFCVALSMFGDQTARRCRRLLRPIQVQCHQLRVNILCTL